MGKVVWNVLIGLAAAGSLFPVSARAQDVTLDQVFTQLGPSAEQITAENLSGTLAAAPRMVEILQAYGVPPAFQTTLEEARMVDRVDREDRALGRVAINGRPVERTVALLRVQASCADNRTRADAADRLSMALWGVSMLNTAGMGLVAATGAGIVFTVPLGFAATVTGFASAAASRLAARYRSAACIGFFGEDRWQPLNMFAALVRGRFRMPTSWRWVCGSWRGV